MTKTSQSDEDTKNPQKKVIKDNSTTIKLIPEDGVLKLSDLTAVYNEFRKPIDVKAIQRTKGGDTHKGYDTTGYGYAFLTERLNDVVGFQCWRIVQLKEQQNEIVSKTGRGMYEFNIELVLQLGNWITDKVTPDKIEIRRRDFEVLAESPIGHGGHKAFLLADAKKGAYTNGIKKCCGYFGIGNEAYKATIDDDNKPLPNEGKMIQSEDQKTINDCKKQIVAAGYKTEEDALKYLKSIGVDKVSSLKNLSAAQARFIFVKMKQNAKNN